MAQAKRDQNRVPTLIGVSSADNTTPTLIAIDPDTLRLLVSGTISSQVLPTGASTEATLAKLMGIGIPEFDYLALTYVAAGNGIGEIETATFKTGGAGGTTVATLALTYNASDEIATVART